MHILQIANNFTTNVLYDELFRRVAALGVTQTVIASTFQLTRVDGYNYKVSQLQRSSSLLSRAFFLRKIKSLWEFTDLETDIANDVDLIHAHTLFSDGAVAYRAHRKYGTPYVVAVRNTDVNVFFKYFVHLRGLGRAILRNASKIILISPIYRGRLRKYLSAKEFESIKDKIEIIPNGVNDIWLNNRDISPRQLHSPIRLIFCGTFDANKNILRIIEAAKALNPTNPVSLKLVGLKANQTSRYIDKILRESTRCDFNIEILNRKPHSELIGDYRRADIFVMPSHTETFGLVYVEAMSQGLPIIYTRNEGFDGFYPDGRAGFAVDSQSVNSIVDGLKRIIENYDSISKNIASIDLNSFSWDRIAERYVGIYKSYV